MWLTRVELSCCVVEIIEWSLLRSDRLWDRPSRYMFMVRSACERRASKPMIVALVGRITIGPALIVFGFQRPSPVTGASPRLASLLAPAEGAVAAPLQRPHIRVRRSR